MRPRCSSRCRMVAAACPLTIRQKAQDSTNIGSSSEWLGKAAGAASSSEPIRSDRTSGAHDIVVLHFRGLVLLLPRGGRLRPMIRTASRVRQDLIWPIARQGHQRIVNGAFGEVGRPELVDRVRQGDPVEHDRAPWVEGETQPIAERRGPPAQTADRSRWARSPQSALFGNVAARLSMGC